MRYNLANFFDDLISRVFPAARNNPGLAGLIKALRPAAPVARPIAVNSPAVVASNPDPQQISVAPGDALNNLVSRFINR